MERLAEQFAELPDLGCDVANAGAANASHMEPGTSAFVMCCSDAADAPPLYQVSIKYLESVAARRTNDELLHTRFYYLNLFRDSYPQFLFLFRLYLVVFLNYFLVVCYLPYQNLLLVFMFVVV